MQLSLLNPNAVIGGGVALLIVFLAVLAWWNKREARAMEEQETAMRCAKCGDNYVFFRYEGPWMSRRCFRCGNEGPAMKTRAAATRCWNSQQRDRLRGEQEGTEGSEVLMLGGSPKGGKSTFALHGADVIADEIEEGGR